MDIRYIISCLSILELPYDKPLTEEEVIKHYRQMCKIYHPDVSNARYKDGKRFIELQDAYDFVKQNIAAINKELGFVEYGSYSYQTNYQEGRKAETHTESTFREEPKKSDSGSTGNYQEEQKKASNQSNGSCEEPRKGKEETNSAKPAAQNSPKVRRKIKKRVIVASALAFLAVLTAIIVPNVIANSYCSHLYDVYNETATCLSDGYKYYRCRFCGDEYSSYEKAIGHNYELTSSKRATCAEYGTETYTCKNCKHCYTKTTSEKKPSHSFTNSFVCNKCHNEINPIHERFSYPVTANWYLYEEDYQNKTYSGLLSTVTISQVTLVYKSSYNKEYSYLRFYGTVDYRRDNFTWGHRAGFRIFLVTQRAHVQISNASIDIPSEVFSGDSFVVEEKIDKVYPGCEDMDFTIYSDSYYSAYGGQ